MWKEHIKIMDMMYNEKGIDSLTARLVCFWVPRFWGPKRKFRGSQDRKDENNVYLRKGKIKIMYMMHNEKGIGSWTASVPLVSEILGPKRKCRAPKIEKMKRM